MNKASISEENYEKVKHTLNNLESHFSNKKLTIDEFVNEAIHYYVNHINIQYNFKSK